MSKTEKVQRKYGEMGKFVVVGDGAVGKTCLLMRRHCDVYPTEYIPTVYEQFTITENVDGVEFEMYAFDMGGGEDFHRLRPLSYPATNVFPLCVDVSNPHSLENVKEVWIPELSHFCPGVPVLLVGCKADLREETKKELRQKGRDFVTTTQAHETAASIGAAGYMECSALTGEGVKEVFRELGRLGLEHMRKERKLKGKCCVV